VDGTSDGSLSAVAERLAAAVAPSIRESCARGAVPLVLPLRSMVDMPPTTAREKGYHGGDA
jgi:hypothetical protein